MCLCVTLSDDCVTTPVYPVLVSGCSVPYHSLSVCACERNCSHQRFGINTD